MKSLKILLGLSMSVVGAGAVAFGVASNKGVSLFPTQASQSSIDFTTANITRRFYFVNNDNWWVGSTLEVHVWGGSLASEQWVTATKMYDSYNYGLYYADISGVGIGAAVNAQIHVKNSSGDYSVGRLLPSLADKQEDVMWLNSGLDGSNRNMSVGSAGGTSGQVASFINFITTCRGKESADYSSSFASGFNAYPQLKANFFDSSIGEITAYGDGTYVEDKDAEDHNYTLNQKISELEYMYNNYGWIAE